MIGQSHTPETEFSSLVSFNKNIKLFILTSQRNHYNGIRKINQVQLLSFCNPIKPYFDKLSLRKNLFELVCIYLTHILVVLLNSKFNPDSTVLGSYLSISEGYYYLIFLNVLCKRRVVFAFVNILVDKQKTVPNFSIAYLDRMINSCTLLEKYCRVNLRTPLNTFTSAFRPTPHRPSKFQCYSYRRAEINEIIHLIAVFILPILT